MAALVVVGVLELLVLVLMAVWLIRSVFFRPAEVVQLQVAQIGRNHMADKLVYSVKSDAPSAADVVARVLTVSVDGVENASQFGAGVTDFGTVEVVEGASVVLTLVDVDNAGNRSEPASVSFVAADTLPPGQPGGFGVTLVGEVTVPDAAPAVDPAPEAPADEPAAPVDVAPEVPADEPAPEVDPNA